jgi:hypothetical protein
MPPPAEDELLVEAAASAYRPRDLLTGAIREHPAWRDLDGAGRVRAFEVATQLRALEAALDPRGLSTTAQAVLARLGASPRPDGGRTT